MQKIKIARDYMSSSNAISHSSGSADSMHHEDHAYCLISSIFWTWASLHLYSTPIFKVLRAVTLAAYGACASERS